MIAVSNDDIEVFPENWGIVSLFCDLGSQWNIGMAGPTGLRYEAAYPLLDRRYKDENEWEQAFDDLRTLERAAIEAMREDD